MSKKLLEVRDLATHFILDEGTVRALEGVSFEIEAGETLGLVGESGCGKSVTALSILRILGPRGKIIRGEILFHRESGAVDLTKLDPVGPEIRSIRGAEIAMIFQEPMTSFSPVYTIGNQIMEAIMLHRTDLDKRQAREYAIHMLDRVGIPKPELRIDSYPGQLSGGMRQRAMIAMALVCNPSLLIADEPTTALDVTTQAQILDLMNDLQAEYGMAIMMITHNLGVVAETTEKVAVMYLGRIVESGPVEVIFDNPLHPYTRALLRSVPKLGRKSKQRLASIKGVVPDAYNIPTGCSFHPRCPECRRGLCDQQLPELKEAEAGHHVSCWVVEQEISQTSADGTVARGDLT